MRGLVLAGGASSRMGSDKAALAYAGVAQLRRAHDLLASVAGDVFVSIRQDQAHDPLRSSFACIVDLAQDAGPAAGLLAAHAAFPDGAWLALACDLPRLDRATLMRLLAARDGAHDVVACRSPHDGGPEPFCAIWEPAALKRLRARVEDRRLAPRAAMTPDRTLLVRPTDPALLDNANTPDDYRRIGADLRSLEHGGAEQRRRPGEG